MKEICMTKKQYKILVVDDNSSNAELLQEIFEKEQYRIYSYTNPLEALIAAENENYDILILDIVMPEMDGFQFAKHFTKIHPETPIVFISGYGNTEKNKVKSYDMGSYGYIEKPINPRTIKAKIKSILKIKILKDELLGEKEKLDNIFKFSDDEIILTDNNFDVVSKNNRLFPLDMKNFLGALNYLNLNTAKNTLLDFKNSNKQHILININLPGHYTNANISKIYDKKGEPIGYLIIIRDVTETVKLERQRKQFIATLTHDLKTPVRAEERALQMLIDGNFGEMKTEQKEILKEILASSKFMSRMTDNLLTKYKIENDSFKIKKEANSLKKTISKCTDSIKYILESKNQVLKIKYKTKNENFYYDEIELCRVLINLISNASEYSSLNQTITVEISETQKDILIKVCDFGVGIAKEDIDHIFEEFHSSAKRFKKVGSGLGLFITKKIVDAHGGNISVESTYGKGTIFTISLPSAVSVSV